MPANVIPIGQPVNDTERKAIAFLRDHLPSGWHILHNFEIRQGGEVYEIDIAVIAPHAVYLLDVKGTGGFIEVIGPKWYPEGRQPYFSPLAKLRNHAKTLHSMISNINPAESDLSRVYVHAAVLLTAQTAVFSDTSGRDKPDVITYRSCLQYLQDKTLIPNNKLGNISRYHAQIIKLITGKAKARNANQVYGQWLVEEKLGGTDRYTEYRARHVIAGKSGGYVRLRVYNTDPYKDENARNEELNVIKNAYNVIAGTPDHTNILSVRDFFPSDEGDKYIIVTEDIVGNSLEIHIMKESQALTFDQKLSIMRGILSALDHAHRHSVIHRNITPDAIIVGVDGQAKLTGFDYARAGINRSVTILHEIIDDLNEQYQDPECYGDLSKIGIPSDIYAVGLVFFKLLTGEPPFDSNEQMMEADSIFPVKATEYNPELPQGIDDWLQKFCMFDSDNRYTSAAVARRALDSIITPDMQDNSTNMTIDVTVSSNKDLENLGTDDTIAERFRVQSLLGKGAFGVTYKVFDSYADTARVIKLVLKDRRSVFDRMKKEYALLSSLPEHNNVVKVIWAERLNDAEQTPYIVFDYVDGLDVSEMIDAGVLSLDDSIAILRDTAKGLCHLHDNGVYHQDIKPSNLLWTDNGVRIIDFNVSIKESDESGAGGGTRRYIPPDYDYTATSEAVNRIDRDLYALGITLFECLTHGEYPFREASPQSGETAKSIKSFKRCSDLDVPFVRIVEKLIAPYQKDRFSSAKELISALAEIKNFRIRSLSSTFTDDTGSSNYGIIKSEKNTNPFVSGLLTLYSQSEYSNAGTRGLDDIGKATYISTLLDENLIPSLLDGKYSLLIISGNAGDGKTAFIQQFEQILSTRASTSVKRGKNGAVIKLGDRMFISNYDGSQDEDDEQNEDVLLNFFESFTGDSSASWQNNQTKIIAINEGRLVDFFLEHESDYPYLSKLIHRGLSGGLPESRVAVLNLNLRSVVADRNDYKSILEQMIRKIVDQQYWHMCDNCNLRDKCYVIHNIKTFQDTSAGVEVTKRLKMLFEIIHMQGKMHITMRDLRSALAYILVGTKDCDAIHQMYNTGSPENAQIILDSFYFNAWTGNNSEDRLLTLFREIDIAEVNNPILDRELGLLSPEGKSNNRFTFEQRCVKDYQQSYDDILLSSQFNQLPRDYSSKNRKILLNQHRKYLSSIRRRFYFERRDDKWIEMLPYLSLKAYSTLFKQTDDELNNETQNIIKAINRGEGLIAPEVIGNWLALRVRNVDKGTIRSYRLFSGDCFSFKTEGSTQGHPYIENYPSALLLHYESSDGQMATLRITLDVYEMLSRLNDGYRPSNEEQEGFYLSLSVFKNILAAAPYQEVLLTENNREFYAVKREDNGVLKMSRLREEL